MCICFKIDISVMNGIRCDAHTPAARSGSLMCQLFVCILAYLLCSVIHPFIANLVPMTGLSSVIGKRGLFGWGY
jgi:hypothetical protein